MSTKYTVEEREWVVIFWFRSYQDALTFSKLPKQYDVKYELNDSVNQGTRDGEYYRVAQLRMKSV